MPYFLEVHANVFVRIFFSMDLPAHSGPRPLIQFRDYFLQTVGLLGRVIARHKHRTTQTQNKRVPTPNIHALDGIRTQIPTSVRAKTVHAVDRAATVTGIRPNYLKIFQANLSL
jgi:hypothetical protein